MKIVNVKTPVIELLFHHRDSESTEDSESFYPDKGKYTDAT